MNLTHLLDQRRAMLSEQLAAHPEPIAVAAETRRFLDLLHAEYRAQSVLNGAQQRVLPFLFDQLKATVNLIVSVNQAQVWQSSSTSDTEVESSRHRPLWQHPWALTGAQAFFVLLLLSSLWGDASFLGFLWLLLLLGSEAVRRMPQLFRNGINFNEISSAVKQFTPTPPPAQNIKTQVNVPEFLNALADAVLTTDKLLAEIHAVSHVSTGNGGLEDYPAVLTLMQDLLEARNEADGQYALRKAKTVPALLDLYQIEVQEFNGDNAKFFEFFPSLNPMDEEVKTLTPALLKYDRLLSRGRVTEPS